MNHEMTRIARIVGARPPRVAGDLPPRDRGLFLNHKKTRSRRTTHGPHR